MIRTRHLSHGKHCMRALAENFYARCRRIAFDLLYGLLPLSFCLGFEVLLREVLYWPPVCRAFCFRYSVGVTCITFLKARLKLG